MNDKDIISNSMSTNGANVNMKINQTLNNINYATPSKEVLISFENLIKNSNTVLLNVNHLKEFYNLLFQAFNEKINYITNENNDLRECYKIILREINKYMDFKKLLLQKLSKDALNTNIYKEENENIVGILIGNKSDNKHNVKEEEAIQFTFKHELRKYFETSAKLDKKIKKAIAYLLEEIIKSKEVDNNLSCNEISIQAVKGKGKNKCEC